MNTFAEAFPPGEILAEELEARGWTQAEFAEVLGRPAQLVSEIIAGKKEITRESASQIAAALGTTAEFWLNMQDRYHLWRQAQDRRTQRELDDVRLRARLTTLAPVAILKQRGLIRGNTLRDVEAELKRLYKTDDIWEDPEILVAARRSVADAALTSTQVAWAACVRQAAEAKTAAAFVPDGLEDLAGRLTRLVRVPEAFSELPGEFAAVGVRLVYVDAFPSSKMDGCSLLLDENSPVIGVSGRGRRMDKVLFTILHETAHVVLRHLEEDSCIIDDSSDGPTLGLEEPANELAGSWVLPSPLPTVPERISASWISNVAATMNVHPIVLIGRLQKDGRIPWRTTLVKDAPTVTAYLEQW
ncbi:HigA family addiction module antitoxin [Actinotalea sp. Marseille-Q4924]|uniref:HigA family addiction module antitoxin n=1 Tax=Actinotalea sp. Marseille-Q4924 TaxID=2866571 RepID=UPI001CE3E526|nr:HigA family addiction module antitoxin [Actinotalea sp. Marseille-Q4924]